MEQWMASRVMDEIRDGRTVLVISAGRHAAHGAYVECVGHLEPGEKARRVAGAEHIESGPGRAAFLHDGPALRGRTADVVVLDGVPVTENVGPLLVNAVEVIR